MDQSNQRPSIFQGRIKNIKNYQQLSQTAVHKDKKKKWLIPVILLLILAAALTIYLLLGFLARGEETLHITLPEAIFAGKDLQELKSALLEEGFVESITENDDNTVTYTTTTRELKKLLAETESSLLESFSAINNQQQHPYITGLNYSEQFTDFLLKVDHEEELNDQALIIASELFMAAVYYQYLAADANTVMEVTVSIEDADSNTVTNSLAYPDDLNRAAKIIKSQADPARRIAAPQAGDKVIVSTGPDNLNLRNGPEITYLIIAILSSGTILEVTGTEGVWLEVITPEGKEGWVHSNYVEIYLEE